MLYCTEKLNFGSSIKTQQRAASLQFILTKLWPSLILSTVLSVLNLTNTAGKLNDVMWVVKKIRNGETNSLEVLS